MCVHVFVRAHINANIRYSAAQLKKNPAAAAQVFDFFFPFPFPFSGLHQERPRLSTLLQLHEIAGPGSHWSWCVRIGCYVLLLLRMCLVVHPMVLFRLSLSPCPGRGAVLNKACLLCLWSLVGPRRRSVHAISAVIPPVSHRDACMHTRKICECVVIDVVSVSLSLSLSYAYALPPLVISCDHVGGSHIPTNSRPLPFPPVAT